MFDGIPNMGRNAQGETLFTCNHCKGKGKGCDVCKGAGLLPFRPKQPAPPVMPDYTEEEKERMRRDAARWRW